MPSNTQVQVQALDKTTGNGASCKAQITSNGMISNILTVPMLVNLSTANNSNSNSDNKYILGQNQDNADKTYTIRSQNCSAGDEVRLTVTTPAPNSKTTVETLLVQ